MLFKIEGFTIECVCIDVLHCLDQGMSLHIIGNVFNDILKRHALAANRKQGAQQIYNLYRAWCKENKVHYRISSVFKPETIRQRGEPPKFRCKAAQARHIVPFVVKLAKEHDDGTRHDRLKIACVEALADFYEMIEVKPRRFTDDDMQQASLLMKVVCSCYASLAKEANEAGLYEWRMVPKLHLCLHLVDYTIPLWGNPRFYWTYADEDLVGHVIEVAQSYHPLTMPAIALFKQIALISILE